MELASGEEMHNSLHTTLLSKALYWCVQCAKFFPPALVNAMRDGEPCLAMQPNPPSLHLVLVLPRSESAAREHFPLGAQPYSLSLHGFCIGHSKKASMLLLSMGCLQEKLPCIQASNSFSKSVAAALFAPFIFLLGLLLLSSLHLLLLSIMLICYNSIQLALFFHSNSNSFFV